MLQALKHAIGMDASPPEINQLDFDPNSIYVVSTPHAAGSSELQAVVRQVNSALEQQGMDHVPVLVLPKDVRLSVLTDEQLLSVGLARKRNYKKW